MEREVAVIAQPCNHVGIITFSMIALFANSRVLLSLAICMMCCDALPVAALSLCVVCRTPVCVYARVLIN